jgi:hypothetical protein
MGRTASSSPAASRRVAGSSSTWSPSCPSAATRSWWPCAAQPCLAAQVRRQPLWRLAPDDDFWALRRPHPSAAILDSQSVKTTERGTAGYDGAKKLNGRKRHLLVDTSAWSAGCR